MVQTLLYHFRVHTVTFNQCIVKLAFIYSIMKHSVFFSAFDFAFELARLAMKQKIPDIHLKNAMFLEDQVLETGEKLFLFSTLLMPVAPAKCGCECEIDKDN